VNAMMVKYELLGLVEMDGEGEDYIVPLLPVSEVVSRRTSHIRVVTSR
jgi:hypothetical protein